VREGVAGGTIRSGRIDPGLTRDGGLTNSPEDVMRTGTLGCEPCDGNTMPACEMFALVDGRAGTMTVSRGGGVGRADSSRPERSGRERGGALRSGGLLGRAGDGRGSEGRIGGAEGVAEPEPGRLVGGGEGNAGGFGEGADWGGGEGEDGGFGEGAACDDGEREGGGFAEGVDWGGAEGEGCRSTVEPGLGGVLGLPGSDLSGDLLGETGLSPGRGDDFGCPLPVGFFGGLSGLEGAGLFFSSLGRVGLRPSLVLPG